MRHRTLCSLVLSFATAALFTVLTATDANAIPAFARKYSMPCSACHTAWPTLNKQGRRFKENGYKFSRSETPQSVFSDFMQFDKSFPVAAVIKSRPYDKKGSGDKKIRALHEVEVLAGGPLHKYVSGFIELEAEDEDNFAVSASGWVTLHPHKAFNVQFAYADIFNADPLSTLSGTRRLTRNRNAVIDQKFGGADNNGRLRDPRQSIAIYGRPIDQVFYSVGYSGVAKDSEGVNASNYHARLAVDVLPELTVGAFGLWGKCESSAPNCAINRDFQRYGFDAQAEVKNVVLRGAYFNTKDDANFLGVGGIPPQVENMAWYGEGSYVIKKDGRPFIVPLIRFDSYEKNNGFDNYDELTLNLSAYIYENVRVFAEYWTQLDTPPGVIEDDRITVQLEFGL